MNKYSHQVLLSSYHAHRMLQFRSTAQPGAALYINNKRFLSIIYRKKGRKELRRRFCCLLICSACIVLQYFELNSSSSLCTWVLWKYAKFWKTYLIPSQHKCHKWKYCHKTKEQMTTIVGFPGERALHICRKCETTTLISFNQTFPQYTQKLICLNHCKTEIGEHRFQDSVEL